MIDRQIRSLIEYEQIHRKVSNFGIKGKILSLCSGGNLFVSVKVWYPMNEKVGSEFFHAHKRYYSLYDTFGSFASAVDVGTKGTPTSTAEIKKLDDSSEALQALALLDNSNT